VGVFGAVDVEDIGVEFRGSREEFEEEQVRGFCEKDELACECDAKGRGKSKGDALQK
jgi:hypothetical protein